MSAILSAKGVTEAHVIAVKNKRFWKLCSPLRKIIDTNKVSNFELVIPVWTQHSNSKLGSSIAAYSSLKVWKNLSMLTLIYLSSLPCKIPDRFFRFHFKSLQSQIYWSVVCRRKSRTVNIQISWGLFPLSKLYDPVKRSRFNSRTFPRKTSLESCPQMLSSYFTT